jgi:hypothetical protein
VKRLKISYDAANAEVVHHGNRGQPANAIIAEIREHVSNWRQASMPDSTTAICKRN